MRIHLQFILLITAELLFLILATIRNEFRKEGVTYKVIKNTLFKRALEETGKYDKLADHLVGMTGYAFASDNPVAPAKIIKKYFDDFTKTFLESLLYRKPVL